MPYRAGNYNDVGDRGKYYIRGDCVLAQRYYYYPATVKLHTLEQERRTMGTLSNSGHTRPYWLTIILTIRVRSRKDGVVCQRSPFSGTAVSHFQDK